MFPEAWFVIDERQRIVQCSAVAAATLAAPVGAVLGQPCYDVVRGCDLFGRSVCRPNCPAFKGLRNGRLRTSCPLVLPSQEGPGKRLRGELVALPEAPGGAFVILSEGHRRPGVKAADDQAIATPASSLVSAADTVHELAVLTTLSASLSPERLEQSVELALDWLRHAVEAEVAELFLAEPRGGDMLLTTHRGPFRAAFSQMTRFHPGEGFPGLVQSCGKPVLTRNLLEDRRYLRTRVKEKGFESYVCVPFLGPNGVMGTLNVAARRRDFDVERALRLLTWASRPITNVLQAGFLQVRENIGDGQFEALQDPEQNLDGLLRTVLHRMMSVADAAGGALLLYDRRVQGVVRKLTEGEFSGVVCPDLMSGNPPACPVLAGAHGMALYGPRRRWPPPCQLVPAGAGIVYCLPLVAGEEELGIVQLGYAGSRPSPPTKYLPVLLNITERAAKAIKQAWVNLQYQQQAQARLKALEQQLRGGLALGDGPLGRRTPEAHTPGPAPGRPFLEIRCLGAFELYRQGRLVTADMLQRRGALTLLKILLTHAGRPVPRDTLAELLWPGAEPEAVANRLYGLVHSLRRLVEPTDQGPGRVFICREDDRYYFNHEGPCRLDAKEFRDHIGLGEGLEREGDVPAAISAYEAAVAVYRGDFLEEEPYADWCWVERAHLKETCLTTLQKLAVLCLEQGALDQSIVAYRRALRIDPLREENYRGLMRALWVAGRRDEALHEYQTCRDTLCRELDVEPLQETEQLDFLIRSNGRP